MQYIGDVGPTSRGGFVGKKEVWGSWRHMSETCTFLLDRSFSWPEGLTTCRKGTQVAG